MKLGYLWAFCFSYHFYRCYDFTNLFPLGSAAAHHDSYDYYYIYLGWCVYSFRIFYEAYGKGTRRLRVYDFYEFIACNLFELLVAIRKKGEQKVFL